MRPEGAFLEPERIWYHIHASIRASSDDDAASGTAAKVPATMLVKAATTGVRVSQAKQRKSTRSPDPMMKYLIE